jgi:hypothetical protein
MNANAQDNPKSTNGADNRLGESMWRELADLFHSRQRWMLVVSWLYALIFFGVAIWAAVEFFCPNNSVRQQIMYATIFIVSAMFVAMMKFWFWMLAGKINILKAIRRLEARIDELAENTGHPDL